MCRGQKKDLTVMMTGAGAPGAPGIIKCLRKNGERKINIVGVDMNENASSKSLVDKFYQVPPASAPGFIDAIKSICVKESVRVILPIVTKELSKFSRSKREFKKLGVKVAVMDKEKIDVANDKGRLFQKLTTAGIPLPDFVLANTVDEIAEACSALGYPDKAVVVKIRRGHGSRGVRIVDPRVSKSEIIFNKKPNSIYISYNQLMLTLKERDTIPEMLVMEYLPGEEYGVDILAQKGEIVQIVGRHNFYMSSSIALGITLEKRADAFKQAKEICGFLEFDGNLGMDIKYNSQGEPRLLEINPRLTAGIVACFAGGVNFPYLGVKQVLGETIVPNKVTYGIKMLRRWEKIFTDHTGKLIEL